MIRDRNIQYARQALYIPVWEFQGYILAEGTPNTVISVADAAPAMAEIGTLEVTGLNMAAGDSVSHVMRFPSFFDTQQEIGVRVRWTVNVIAETDDGAEWIFLYNVVPADRTVNSSVSATRTAFVAAATALDTTLSAAIDAAGAPVAGQQEYGSTSAGVVKETPRGIINASTFDADQRLGQFIFNVELQAVTNLLADEVSLLGVTLDYIPLLTVDGVNATQLSAV